MICSPTILEAILMAIGATAIIVLAVIAIVWVYEVGEAIKKRRWCFPINYCPFCKKELKGGRKHQKILSKEINKIAKQCEAVAETSQKKR